MSEIPPKLKRRQQRILRLVRYYQELTGLGQWQIEVMFGREKDGAACAADDEYLQAMLYFDLDNLNEADEERIVLHEILHCHTWELVRVSDLMAGRDKHAKEMVRAARERCTTLLERMPVWAHLRKARQRA